MDNIEIPQDNIEIPHRAMTNDLTGCNILNLNGTPNSFFVYLYLGTKQVYPSPIRRSNNSSDNGSIFIFHFSFTKRYTENLDNKNRKYL